MFGERSERGVDLTTATQPPGVQTKYHVRSLARAIAILKCFDVARPSWRPVDLARETGLDNATCYRMIKTFESEGLLAFDEPTGEYHLGRALLRAVYLVSSNRELAWFAHPFIRRLADATGETVTLAVWTNEGVLFIDQVVTYHPFKLASTVGLTFTNWGNANCKALVAFGPDSRQQQFAAWNDGFADDPAQRERIDAEIAGIRRAGVAYDLEEDGKGICAVAAPVRDRGDELIASLAVVAPSERFREAAVNALTMAVKEAAADMSLALG